ncbi:hypothetical protein ASPZODRAFT_136747 [Penicilliopsis zonata CBS 506.65]|uniref:FAD dependent oxidoreductase domain-containing protein n=1 Tax=Penicilliopsis zonata CBS 506.65 TaxID=1073090 RepID=A0A1L9S6T5_9EURO|nr:hypothetical protein ASPZODRAFT_136747 [Penicilliopsis zonata CBS 506.65]OJJ42894.1 hypothetical protein ASPZODRAFT_136747 [Penicilliopsis zonata CBS 506.65]
MSKDAPIVIVGAGVFGLTSAIHLARRGYTKITVFDRQPYHETWYDFDKGCDAASADRNKIIRAAYGDEVWYQNLTLQAIDEWEGWNATLAAGKDLPPGMTAQDRIYVNCGTYRMGDESSTSLSPFEERSIHNLTAAGRGQTQYLLHQPGEVARARADGFAHGIDPFQLADKTDGDEGEHRGYLDMIGGFVYADKACRFALHLAQQLGVTCVLDSQAGQFVGFVEEESSEHGSTATRRVVGIRTADGKQHRASITILACGGWTPSLLPAMDGLCETTAGSIATLSIPDYLRERFSPDNFPVWLYRQPGGSGGDLYGFPVDEQGVMKLGYRGTKFTNPQVQAVDGRFRSVPITRWTRPDSITGLPAQSLRVIRGFLDAYLPELRANGVEVSDTRLCWYTDSFDNQFVVDNVPGREGLLVATGGSGHAFKFLPVLGRFVADRVEGIDSDLLRRWRWRKLQEGEKPHNGFMTGPRDAKALQNVQFEGDVSKL